MKRLTELLRRASLTSRRRLVLLLGAVGVLWLASAAVDHLVLGQFDTPGAAVWSGLEHLLDPSSLQDDETAARRAVGLFQVVVGLFFLVGILFAVSAEAVGRSLARLGGPDPPMRARDHVVVVGGSELFPVILAGLSRLARSPSAPRSVVALAPPSERERRAEVQAQLRRAAPGLDVRLALADPTTEEGLAVAAPRDARAVILTRASGGPAAAESADLEVVRTGAALARHLRGEPSPPDVYLLFRRGRNVDAAWGLFPEGWDALVGDRSVAAALRSALLLPRFAELLPGRPSGVLPTVRPAAEHTGRRFHELPTDALGGLPIGLVGPESRPEVRLVPDPETVLDAGDRVALLPAGRAGEGRDARRLGAGLNLLVVGWNFNAPALVQELDDYAPAPVSLTVLVDPEQRHDLPAGLSSGTTVEFREGPPFDPAMLREAVEQVRPDAAVVLPSPVDWDLRAADAGAALALMQLRRSAPANLHIVAESFFPPDLPMLEDVLVVSDLELLSTTVGWVIADTAGARVGEALLSGALPLMAQPHRDGEAPFSELWRRGLERGELPLGLADSSGARLAPAPGTRVAPGDELLVLGRR